MNSINLLVGLSFAGLIVSIFIYVSKKFKKKIFCPFNMGCDTVLRSKYGSLFGFPNELLGMAYYLFLPLSYTIASNHLAFRSPELIVLAAFLAAMMSAHLIYLQVKVLKKYCFWCLISAALNLFIFYLVIDIVINY